MDKNEFFKEATMRICGSLEIEKAMHSTLVFLRSFLPVDIMFMERYNTNINATRTIAKATTKKGYSLNLITPHTPAAEKWAALYRTNKTKPVYLYQNPGERPLASEMMRFHKINLTSVILLPLKSDDTVIGSLIVGSETSTFSQRDADLITSLNEPFALAMSNALRYNELVQLKESLVDDNQYLHQEIRNISGQEIIGAKYGLKDVMQKVQQVAKSESPVLLTGETGVGKDVIANAIHYSSSRSKGPMINVNCGAIPESLIDSELFGHEKGAFTGALSQKRGRFERADKGTIFLDEIGELPLLSQVKLLRVLQTKEFERLGGIETISPEIRVIAATNRDLEKMVAKGEFREDLWFRLNVFPIHIPPLRERKIDIPALLQYLIEKKAGELKLSTVPEVLPGAIDQLLEYNWPGNVRELQNLVERELIINPKGPLSFANFIVPKAVIPGENQTKEPVTYDKLDDVIAHHIKNVLDKTEGKIHGKRGAADILGINASTLRNRMNKLGIKYGKRRKS